MQQMREPSSEGQPPQRRVIRKAPPVRVPEPGEDVDLQAQLAAFQAAMTGRLEEGLKAIHRSAAKLMRQVAAEVWRTAGPASPEQVGQGVIEKLARDDAMRGVMAHVDERYQSLHFELQKTTEGLKRLVGATGQAATKADQSRELVERVAHAAQEQGRRIQHGFQELATRVQRALEPLSARMEALEALHKSAEARQRAELQQFQEHMARGIRYVGQRLREGFAAMTERSAEENRAAIAKLEAAVQQEMERLRQQSHEQAARSVEAMHVVSRSVHEAAERSRGELETMRGAIEARIEVASHNADHAVSAAVAELRARVEEMIDAAVERIGSRTAALIETMPAPAVAPVPAADPPPLELVTSRPEQPQEALAEMGEAVPEPAAEPIDFDIAGLDAAFENLSSLDLDDEPI